MKKLNKFENWFRNLGGDINNLDVSIIFDKLNQRRKNQNWLKNNSIFVKENINYKFNFENR